VTPSPSQPLSPSHPPHQVAPREVLEMSDVSERRSRTISGLVGRVNGWPTLPTKQDAVGSKLSSQAGGPGPAPVESEAAGKPSPTSTTSGSDSASRPASSGIQLRGSSLTAHLAGVVARDPALAGGIRSGRYPRWVSASSADG
jgi:hypothetical protein